MFDLRIEDLIDKHVDDHSVVQFFVSAEFEPKVSDNETCYYYEYKSLGISMMFEKRSDALQQIILFQKASLGLRNI